MVIVQDSFVYAVFYIDNKELFELLKTIVLLSKEVFDDYAETYRLENIMSYDKAHEYTVDKSATLLETFDSDTIKGKAKMTVFIK